MNLPRSRSLAAVLSFCAVAHAEAAIINNYSAAVNDRFENDPSFIADSYDLSGVAIDDTGRWLTMISPNVFLSSSHLAPLAGSSVTFYTGNDSSGPSLSTTVFYVGQAVADSDLWIGVLSDPLPSSYNFYDYATQPITNNNPGGNPDSWQNSPYFMADALVTGRSPGPGSISIDMAVGQNRLDTYFGAQTVNGVTGVAIGSEVDVSSDPNFLPYELQLTSGDSGGPVFVDVDGELTLVGINWFSGNEGSLNGYTYVGNYGTEIGEFLDVYSVPEPSDFALGAGLAVVAVAFVRRRRLTRACPVAE